MSKNPWVFQYFCIIGAISGLRAFASAVYAVQYGFLIDSDAEELQLDFYDEACEHFNLQSFEQSCDDASHDWG